jgi:long-chain-fatty-acid--CoA ligase ACSBG
MKKIYEIKNKLSNLKAIVQIHSPYAQYVKKSDNFYRWSELEEMSIEDDQELQDEYQKRLLSISANECCLLVFTSGTVGNPKGVMMSHDNLIWTAQTGISTFGKIEVGNEVLVSYLPMSHAAAQVLDISAAILSAATVYFADKNAMKGTLMETLKEAQPTLFFTVPRLFEKIHEKMLVIGSQNGAVKRALGSWAKRVTLKHHMDRIMNGHSTNSIQYRLASKLVLSKVKEALGFQRCRTFFTGAAPLSPATKEYFLSLDMLIFECYGMSESNIHTITKGDTKSFNSVGSALPGTETKIININEEGHGEICMRGRHVFMGYIGDMEKTIETIDDERWLRSGDLGYIDENGYLYVTGRIKELIITAGGENIPYLLIERNVKNECAAISNAFLVGDCRKFLTMLITIKTEFDESGAPKDDLTAESKQWFESVGQSYTKLSEILNTENLPKVNKTIQECINRANEKSISNAQKVQKFALLPHDFTIATNELTPTMKLKRNVVLKKYQDLIDHMYE